MCQLSEFDVLLSNQRVEPHAYEPLSLMCREQCEPPARELFLSALSNLSMSTIHALVRNRISLSAVSIALLICSAVWFASACAYYATSAFKNDWSATPLPWILIMMVTPAVSFGTGMILVDARKHSQFSLLEWCALAAGFFPVTLGTLLTVWAVKVLFRMSGVGV
jgi:hypothetical protein